MIRVETSGRYVAFLETDEQGRMEIVYRMVEEGEQE